VEDKRENEKAEIYSQRIKAGKRTYFFDIKSTRGNDYYLTITESKKRFKEDGFYYEKHKIFLYKEDFAKFIQAMENAVDFMKTELLPNYDFTKIESSEEETEDDLKWE
jgi:hypothetical protein